MHQKLLSCKIIVLMILALSVSMINGQDTTADPIDSSTPCTGDDCTPMTSDPAGVTPETTAAPSTAAPSTVEPTKAPATTIIPSTVPAKQTKPFNSRTTKKPSKKDDYDSYEDSYETDDECEESKLELLDVWITFVDPWELNNKFKNKVTGRGSSRNTKKTKKPTSARVRFPVRHYPNYNQFPIQRYSPLVSIVPWLPIYYDKNTYQTVIFSPSGGIYIMPPLINFYGQRFSVAQLIQWGYASLVSTGAPPPPNVDVAPLVQPTQPASDTNAQAPGSGLQFDEKRGQFNGGVKTQFRQFKPQYSKTLYEAPESRYTYRNE